MSWASRFNNLGRFSPFTRSPPTGSTKVSDADFSYITADDLRKHGADGVAPPTNSSAGGPPRETDALVLRNKRKDTTVHFPAYSIDKGDLTIGQVRQAAAGKMGTSDLRRIKLLYRGKNLKDDSRTAKAEGLRNEAELLLTVADVPSTDGSEDEDDQDEVVSLGEDGEATADGEPKRRRNRGKKSKKRNKREAVANNSGTSTPSNLQPPGVGGSQLPSRAQSPKPPQTPLEKLEALRAKLGEYLPQVDQFLKSPPSDPVKREFDHKRLSETVLAQVLLKLDAVETEGDADARARRKELVRETQAVLTELDAAVKQ